jgi:rhodanese-related sulfurtransferase/glyoxylase-like metal-dependent hydrolase (beta-lactamase superfamily II)
MRTWSIPGAAGAVSVLALAGMLPAQDVEQATHTDTASLPKVAFEHRGAEHVLRQYQLGCLSHLSYLLASKGEAAVVDPQRDVEHYVSDARELGAQIKYVLLTHPHADFVAGHTELMRTTGAAVLIARAANAEFPHRALRDGDRVIVGSASIEAWDTPGHTPNASTFLVRVAGAEADPAFALTGDTLFVGSIGRPDLLDVPPAGLASQSFDSIQRLKALPDGTLVLPAHGAGSLCGAHLSPDTTSTIGREKATNPYLQIHSRATFVANVISHQPVAPQYFAFNVELNRKGPPPVERDVALPAVLAPAAAKEIVAKGGWIVDLRDQHAYAESHIAGAVNVALRGRLDTWTGIVVPFDAALVLVGSEAEVREGAFRLRRIGYDQAAGRLEPDAAAWRAAGLPVRTSKLVSPRELFASMQKGTEPLIVDVRTAEEYADLRLGDVGNIPVTESERFARALLKDAPVLMVCDSAYRSSLAIGLAERLGFTDVASLDGGLDAWVSAGLPTVGRMAPVPRAAAAPAAQAGAIALPEPVDPSLLATVLMDQPQAYAVIDLRPAWQFAEWRIPGTVNVLPDAVAAHVAALPARSRVVLVDRDGTVAFAVAGALMARTPARVLRVLVGGVQRFYRETTFAGNAGAAAMPVGQRPAAAPPAAPGPAAPAATPTPTPKKRSAGC